MTAENYELVNRLLLEAWIEDVLLLVGVINRLEVIDYEA